MREREGRSNRNGRNTASESSPERIAVDPQSPIE